MAKIALIENGPRGFLSNYTTLLTSFRDLVDRRNINPDDIFISSSMFSLYGNPENWFDSKKITNVLDGFIVHDSVTNFDLSVWPTYKELELQKYIQYIPFNSRVKKILEKDRTNYSNTLGIHYRGTDNRPGAHTDFIPVEDVLKSASEEFEANFYDSIFISSDEEGVVEIFKEYFFKNHNFKNILYFDHIRTTGNVGLHFSNFSPQEKILLGDQVLIDATTLSKCKTVIGKTSNLINYARILTPNLEVLYQDLNTNFVNGVRSSNNNFPQIRTVDIQPFIFNWRGQFKKTCDIEDSLKEIFDDVIVINSDEENTRDGWINLGDEAYFTMQFRKALELLKPDKKVLMHCQGDTVFENYKNLVNDAQKYFNAYEWGIYAPDITNVWYTSENTDIKGIDSEDKNIKMVACTDETVWFIHRDIIDDFYRRNLSDFMTPEKMKMGWGWDLVMNAISFIMHRPVIRDYNHQIQHVKGSNYSNDIAAKEMENLWKNLPQDLKECISYIKGDREQIVKYFT
jgi:hypothetical protein